MGMGDKGETLATSNFGLFSFRDLHLPQTLRRVAMRHERDDVGRITNSGSGLGENISDLRRLTFIEETTLTRALRAQWNEIEFDRDILREEQEKTRLNFKESIPENINEILDNMEHSLAIRANYLTRAEEYLSTRSLEAAAKELRAENWNATKGFLAYQFNLWDALETGHVEKITTHITGRKIQSPEELFHVKEYVANRPLEQDKIVNCLPPKREGIQQAYEYLFEQSKIHVKLAELDCGSVAEKVILVLANEQPTGSFKDIAALNDFHFLPRQAYKKGIVAVSSGNHGLAVARLAKEEGIRCTIVVPTGAPDTKVNKIRAFDAKVIMHGETYDDAHTYALRMAAKRGPTFLDVSSNHVTEAYGALGMWIMRQIPHADYLFTACGGGALAAGTSLGMKMVNADAKFVAVEAEESACAYASIQLGKLINLLHYETIADGTKLKGVDPHLFDILKGPSIFDFVTATPYSVRNVMDLLTEATGHAVEGAGALPLAPVLRQDMPLHGAKENEIDLRGRTVVVLIGGGNVDSKLIGKPYYSGGLPYARYPSTMPEARERTWQEMGYRYHLSLR
ncbi:MAG: pyridoxal-phosphate dependent enzyme [Ktedonobacteraceae bacterium]|nr:pyridoxal-phosphate dependent enzyme [Ktedonobacteraceae bacterium]